MGLSGLTDICRQLIAHGAKPDFPIAIVQNGTIASQKVLVGTLTDLPERVKTSGFTSPCLIIIGEVVKLHQELAWYPSA
jgi:uroporphyrin-III C-methyltransferase/precorrin-2 dehydrogenase/sirohydrochlorin ferrochelatase